VKPSNAIREEWFKDLLIVNQNPFADVDFVRGSQANNLLGIPRHPLMLN
jgi:hypothetical protein